MMLWCAVLFTLAIMLESREVNIFRKNETRLPKWAHNHGSSCWFHIICKEMEGVKKGGKGGGLRLQVIKTCLCNLRELR